MTTLLVGTASAAVWTGVVGGAACGVANLLASHWTSRKALALGERHAVQVMVAGFVARLALLALVILAVPRAWMCPEAFVLTFLGTFVLGVAIEARAVARAGGGRRRPEEPPAA